MNPARPGRPGRTEYAHLYGRQWRVLRAAYLAMHGKCVYCLELGYHVRATVVDHKIPHEGDRALFFDQSNWQPLCKLCHDGAKQQLERTGRRPGTRPDGTPVDPSHPWNRADDASGRPAGEGIGVADLAPRAGQRTPSQIFARAKRE